METLYFITPDGVCGHTEEWDAKGPSGTLTTGFTPSVIALGLASHRFHPGGGSILVSSPRSRNNDKDQPMTPATLRHIIRAALPAIMDQALKDERLKKWAT